MKEMTNELFFQVWKDVCAKNQKMLYDSWDDFKKYTRLILREEDCIISKVATEINKDVFYEYYSSDAVFYEKNDIVNDSCPKKTWSSTQGLWLKHIQIAFEHENRLSGPCGGYQEICHLLTINADIKVLVGYAEHTNYDNYAIDFQSILQTISDKQQSILFILGYIANDVIIWNGYVITKEKYMKI